MKIVSCKVAYQNMSQNSLYTFHFLNTIENIILCLLQALESSYPFFKIIGISIHGGRIEIELSLVSDH